MNIDKKFFEVFLDAWRFKIYTIDGNNITVGTLVVGLVFLLGGIFLSRVLSRKTFEVLGKKFEVERNARHVFESITFYFLSVLSFLFAMKIAHLPLTVFTVVGGAFAIGFGLGSQNLVNNFMSGLILMIERPIKIGDFVEVDGVFGEVENIGMRSTGILTFGNQHIIVPNSFFLEKNVRNWTRTNKEVRIGIDVGVAYGSPTRKVKGLLIEAAGREPKVLRSPGPDVWFSEFSDSALTFHVNFWIKLATLSDRRDIESNIRFHIDDVFREAGIVIAFPQRDVHLKVDAPIGIKMLGGE